MSSVLGGSTRRRWQRLVDRVLPSAGAVEADELQQQVRGLAATPLAEAPLATPVTVSGTIRAVTLRPRGEVAALEAELYDGSGAMTLIWLGRRSIRGVTPGRAVVAFGRITERADRRVMFNPQYELLPERR
jgi:hypothetical protein